MLKDRIEARTGLKLKAIAKGAKHEVGKKYYDGYWRKVYEVLETKQTGDWRGWSVKCKWQDGHINKHSTSLTPGKDFEVIA